MHDMIFFSNISYHMYHRQQNKCSNKTTDSNLVSFWHLNFKFINSQLFLTLYLLNSFFRRFSGHSLRQALFVYRLIVATLIGNFFDYPFLN